MPRQQLMIERANEYFQYGKLSNPTTKPSWTLFPADSSLGSVLSNPAVRIADEPPSTDVDVANKMPFELAESLKEVIRNNLKRPTPYSIQFLWWPADSWKVDFIEVPPVKGSVGGISVLIMSPADPLAQP